MNIAAHKKFFTLLCFVLIVFLGFGALYFATKLNRDSLQGEKYENILSDVSDFNVSKEENKILLLCFVMEEKLINDSFYCFNKKDGSFQVLDLELLGIDVKYEEQFWGNYDTLKLFSLDLISGQLSSSSKTSLDYEEKLIKVLEDLEISDFIVGKNLETNQDYIDQHDYISVKVSLIKYYKNIGDDEKYLRNLNELKDKFKLSPETNKEILWLFPPDIDDIEYLQNLDSVAFQYLKEEGLVLAELLRESMSFSNSQEVVSENHGIGKDEFSAITNLYKIQSIFNQSKPMPDSYLETLRTYRSNLLQKTGLSEEELDLLGLYIPVPDIYTLNYFKNLWDSGNDQEFFDKLLVLSYFVYQDGEGIEYRYKISNILFETRR